MYTLVSSNDIAAMPVSAPRHRLAELLLLMKAALPRTVIVWSDMFPYLQYRGANCTKTVAKASRTINHFIHNFAVKNGIKCIRHQGITQHRRDAFLGHGVHLSDIGCGTLYSGGKFQMPFRLSKPLTLPSMPAWGDGSDQSRSSNVQTLHGEPLYIYVRNFGHGRILLVS